MEEPACLMQLRRNKLLHILLRDVLGNDWKDNKTASSGERTAAGFITPKKKKARLSLEGDGDENVGKGVPIVTPEEQMPPTVTKSNINLDMFDLTDIWETKYARNLFGMEEGDEVKT
jgi:hypothetical protein